MTLGVAKKDLGLIKSKERGLLNKDVFNEEMKGKEIEIGQNQEERSNIEKTIGNMREELSAEDLEKRRITKSFEFIDGKIIKKVQASRTEQGMIDAAGKLLNEKIENLEKDAGADLVKEKEGLEKHYFSKEKIAEMTKYLDPEAKDEIIKKISQEESDIQNGIKGKEENLKAELDVFRIPFQDRLNKTNEISSAFSDTLKYVKESEAKYNGQLKDINSMIEQAQKSGLLEESRKEVVDKLNSKRAEFVEKAGLFRFEKLKILTKLGQLKNNKTDLEKMVNKINGIGKTKKEIVAERAAKTEDAKKTEKNTTEPADKKEEEKTAGKKSNDAEFVEDGSFMGGDKIKNEEEIKEEDIKGEENRRGESFTEKEIESIVITHLKIMGLRRVKDKKIQDQIIKNSIVNVKKMIAKDEEPITEICIRKETKRVFDALSAGYF